MLTKSHEIEVESIERMSIYRGNWEHGNNVLFRTHEHEYFCETYQLNYEQFHSLVKNINAALFLERQKRIKPSTDDKILTEWNALLITGLVDAYRYRPSPVRTHIPSTVFCFGRVRRAVHATALTTPPPTPTRIVVWRWRVRVRQH